MSKTVQHKGGSTLQNNSYTGAERELTVDITKNTLRVHDGVTPGGTELARIIDLPAPALPHIGTTPPLAPAPGQLWWESESGNLYIYYTDDTSSQWVPATVNAGPQGEIGPEGPQGDVGPQGPAGFGISNEYLYLGGNVSGTVNIDFTISDTQSAILVGNTTFVLPTLTGLETRQLTIFLRNDSTGGHSIITPNVYWVGKVAPIFDSSANAANVLLFRGVNGLWIGDGGPVA